MKTNGGPARFTSIVQTCGACPSQWEGHLTDGRMFFARYRHGFLTLHFSRGPTGNVYDALGPQAEQVFSEGLGDGLDGWMDTATMLGHVADAMLDARKAEDEKP